MQRGWQRREGGRKRRRERERVDTLVLIVLHGGGEGTGGREAKRRLQLRLYGYLRRETVDLLSYFTKDTVKHDKLSYL